MAEDNRSTKISFCVTKLEWLKIVEVLTSLTSLIAFGLSCFYVLNNVLCFVDTFLWKYECIHLLFRY